MSILEPTTITDLRLLEGTPNQRAMTLSYHTPNLSLANPYTGGRDFAWDETSIEADNGGTVIQVTGIEVGRWIGINNDITKMVEFGVTGDGVTNDYTSIMDAWAATPSGSRVEWPFGICNIGSNILTIPDKILDNVGKSSYIGAGTEIVGSNLITVDTPAAPNNTGRGTTFRNMYVTNTNENGTGIRIRNGGLVLKDFLAQGTGANGIGCASLGQWGLYYENCFFGGSGTGWSIEPDGTLEGGYAVVNNHFNRIMVSGHGGNGNGLVSTGGNINLSNIFTAIDIENTLTAVTLDCINNTFNNIHFEAFSVTGLVEAETSSNVFINPSFAVDGDASFSKSSQVISSNTEINFPAAIGRWTTDGFNASKYSASGDMTWVVEAADVKANQYTRIGNTVTLSFNIGVTSVEGTPSWGLRILLPTGVVPTKTVFNTCYVMDGGNAQMGYCSVSDGGTFISIAKDGGGNWTPATAISVYGQIIFEVD